MPREYQHIQLYETETLRLKEEGKTLKEIGENLGFSYKQVHNLNVIINVSIQFILRIIRMLIYKLAFQLIEIPLHGSIIVRTA